MNFFKLRLVELIKQSGKMQTEIAKELNIEKQKITHWKSGYIEPNIDDLIKLARYFNVSIDYLVGNENEDGRYNNIVNSFNQINGNNINFKG